MKATSAAAILLAGGLTAAMGIAAPQNKDNAASHAQQPAGRQQPKNPQAQAKAQDRGDEVFLKLQQMTPDEREKALSVLPPAQRDRIQKRIDTFQKRPPAEQERRIGQLERLHALPLDEQAHVRQSTKALQELPQDRRRAVNQELQRMSVMGDDEKQYHMNTDEFRNRFSPAEQEMIGSLTKVF
jgi:hypothetical protein